MNDKFLPWNVMLPNKENGFCIKDNNGETISDLYFVAIQDGEVVSYDNSETNAAHIVTCVNSHNVLVEALENMLSMYKVQNLCHVAGGDIVHEVIINGAESALKLAKGE